MPIADPNRIFDGFTNLVSGMDDGRRPNLLDQNQYARGDNLVVRGGDPTTRPPMTKLSLTSENPNLTYGPSGNFSADPGPTSQGLDQFKFGLFQGAQYYAPMKGQEYIMVSIAGRLYRITPSKITGSIREIQLERRNRSVIPIAYHLQAGKYFIVQDGEAQPIIYDASVARRSMPTEIFTGKMMGYGQGRIVLVGVDNQIYFGDIRDGKGNGDTDLLGFTETTFLNEGFPSALPSGMGDPTAITFIAQQDSATGVGECLVFGENGVESFYLSLPRETWKDSAFQHTALLGIGCTGHRAVVPVNEDIWFRSKDGMRSYRQARAQINQWAQIPMSSNVSEWMEADEQTLLNLASCISFDKRLITTCTPYPNQGFPYHNGLLSLDFDILSTFGNLTNPAWDGHWGHYDLDPIQGLRVLQVVSGMFGGDFRAFAFIRDTQNRLYEIHADTFGDDEGGPITAELITRSMEFNSEFNEKNLYGADLWIDSVTDETSFDISYRPDQYPDFTEWYSFSESPISGVPQGDAMIDEPGFTPRRSLPKPMNDSDTLSTNRILRRFYELQVKMRFTGRAAIRKFRLHAQAEVEDARAKLT